MVPHHPIDAPAERRTAAWAVAQVLAFTVTLATVARAFVGRTGALVLAVGILVVAVGVWAVVAQREAHRGPLHPPGP